jgi:heme o synthase
VQHARVHRFAVATALATYLLIVVGGLVNGAAVRPGAALAQGHRAAAAVVGALTLGLALLLTRGRRAAGVVSLSRLGWLAVAMVTCQAALGAVGVVLHLPPEVGAVHTGLSLLFFVVVFYLAAQTADGAERRPEVAPAARRLALVAAVAVLFQALLGALVRASGAALACPDLPLCRGAVWPQAHVTVQLNVVHRLGAAVVALLLFASAIRMFRAAGGRAWLRALALSTPVLAAAQISLGVRSVHTFLDLAMVQAHLAVGAALLAAAWGVYLLSAPLGSSATVAALSAPRAVAAAAGLGAQVRALVELTKPRITFMVVVTFAGGLWLAPGAVDGWRGALALLGTVLIVAAANALNMYLERDIDGRMRRTAGRPLPQGRISADLAVGAGAAMACAALPLLLLGANLLTAALGLLAFASYVWAYTPLKRVSGAALFVGAVPGAMPPLMGWTTATGHLDVTGLVLFGILFLWQVPHFLAIAVYRAEDYAAAGFRVLPASVGMAVTRWTIVVFTAALAAVAVLPAPLGAASTAYLVAALVLGAGFLAWAMVGFGARAVAAPGRWARSLFLASLVYLTLLFAALALDRAAMGAAAAQPSSVTSTSPTALASVSCVGNTNT